MLNQYACKRCGSPSVIFPKVVKPEATIRRQKCNVVICTVADFRDLMEVRQLNPELHAR